MASRGRSREKAGYPNKLRHFGAGLKALGSLKNCAGYFSSYKVEANLKKLNVSLGLKLKLMCSFVIFMFFSMPVNRVS